MFDRVEQYLQELVALADVRNPIEQPSIQDWDEAERSFGCALPQDFKRLVTILGNGGFGGEAHIGGELNLFNPVCSSEYTVLSPENILRYNEYLQDEANPLNFHLYPEPGGYMVVGTTGYQIHLLIECSSLSIPYKTMWFGPGSSAAYALPMTVCQFIHHLYFDLLDLPWARELRGLIWYEDSPFYVSRPGRRG